MTDLEPFPEDWERGLAVVAHPDDMEYGAAAAVARWTAQGKWIGYVLVTDGEAGIATMAPAEAGPIRRSEQQASCEVVGVHEVEFLGRPDGAIVESLELRADLAAAIRRHRPDVVLSINFRDSWGGPSWNHADHRAVGRALARRRARRRQPVVVPRSRPGRGTGAAGSSPSAAARSRRTASTRPTTFDLGVPLARVPPRRTSSHLGGEMASPADVPRRGAEEAGAAASALRLAATFEIVG